MMKEIVVHDNRETKKAFSKTINNEAIRTSARYIRPDNFFISLPSIVIKSLLIKTSEEYLNWLNAHIQPIIKSNQLS